MRDKVIVSLDKDRAKKYAKWENLTEDDWHWVKADETLEDWDETGKRLTVWNPGAYNNFGIFDIAWLDKPSDYVWNYLQACIKYPLLQMDNPEWYNITGRGKIASYGPGRLPQGLVNPRQLLHRTILIDDSRYLVTGVEMFAVSWEKYDKSFGLLVRPLDSNASKE